MATGNKCTIFDKIDALSTIRSGASPEFVAALQNILGELAYYSVMSEGSVLETHEEWHGAFTDRLYEAAGAEAQGRQPAAHPSRQWSAPAPPQLVAQPARRQKKTKPGDGRDGVARPQQPPPSNRPRPDHITPALMAIMKGTHESFREDDT